MSKEMYLGSGDGRAKAGRWGRFGGFQKQVRVAATRYRKWGQHERRYLNNPGPCSRGVLRTVVGSVYDHENRGLVPSLSPPQTTLMGMLLYYKTVSVFPFKNILKEENTKTRQKL